MRVTPAEASQTPRASQATGMERALPVLALKPAAPAPDREPQAPHTLRGGGPGQESREDPLRDKFCS